MRLFFKHLFLCSHATFVCIWQPAIMCGCECECVSECDAVHTHTKWIVYVMVFVIFSHCWSVLIIMAVVVVYTSIVINTPKKSLATECCCCTQQACCGSVFFFVSWEKRSSDRHEKQLKFLLVGFFLSLGRVIFHNIQNINIGSNCYCGHLSSKIKERLSHVPNYEQEWKITRQK